MTMTSSRGGFEFHIVGGFSVDAVVYPDDRYETDRLGGNALWASMGARVAGSLPRVHSIVGREYPAEALVQIGQQSIDTSGVTRNENSEGVRVTFSYNADGSRSQPAEAGAVARIPHASRARFIDTTRRAHVMLDALPTVDDLKHSSTTRPSGWHVGLLPSIRFRELIDHLSTNSDYVQADCPARFELRRDGLSLLSETLDAMDVFLPSTSDTSVFAPDVKPAELLDLFHGLGSRLVVLKCGSAGAIVSERGGDRWHVPIYEENTVVDTTGAGDVFAGAFGAMQSVGSDILLSACAGAAAASLSLRHSNPLALGQVDAREFDARRRVISRGVTKL